MTEWQPIETAPPEATDLLVCVTYSLGGAAGQEEWETVQWVDSYLGGNRGWAHYPFMIWIPSPPTHWMPLPEPPK